MCARIPKLPGITQNWVDLGAPREITLFLKNPLAPVISSTIIAAAMMQAMAKAAVQMSEMCSLAQ